MISTDASNRKHSLFRWSLSLVFICSALVLTSTKTYQPTPVHAAISWTGGSAAGSGAAPWETFSGNINLDSGNLMLSAGGLSIAGVNGLDEAVVPVYNSVSSANATDMGNGWIITPGRDVGLLINSTSATFYDETGHGWTFAKSGSTFTAPAGADAQLVQNGDGTYTLTDNASGFQHQFDSGGYLTAIQNRAGNRISFSYDGTGKLTQITNTEGQLTSIGYDAQNRITSVTDSGTPARTWSYAYDGNNNLAQVTDPDSHQTQFGYDASHRLTQITDPNGNKTLISYGSLGVSQIVTVSDPVHNTGPTWTFSYGQDHLSATVTDPNSHTVSYTMDSSHRVTKITAGPSTSNLSWNADNQVTQVLDNLGTTKYTYDTNNNLAQVTLPTQATASAQYTDTAHPYLPSSITDTQGNTSTIQYTTQGLVSQVTDGLGHSASWTYNSNGTVAGETDENGHQTTHTYNALGLPAGDTPPAPLGPVSYSFNSYDQEASVTDGKGQLTTFTYDGEGRVKSVAFADGGSLGYSYDAAGNVLAMTDGTGTTTYTYDTLNQLTKKTLPNGQTVSYTYDAAGNLLTKTDSGGTVTYTYQNDARDLVSSVTDRSNNTTTLGYDALGNLTSMAFPNGITQNMIYNSAGQLTSIYAQNANLHKFTSFGYSYTNPTTNQATGLPYSVTDTAGNVTTNTYDGVNQLTQAIQKTSGGTTLHSYSFGFDPAGNMTSKSVDGTNTTFTYNAANELTQASGGINKTYTYDGNGDLTSISDGTQLTLNAAGQITSITPPGGGPINMTYTGVGETQRVGAGTKNYQYDATGLSKQTDASNSTYFTSLPDGTVISESVSGSTYYYLSDGAGSVAGLMDSAGALKNQYAYDPLGTIISSSGTVSNPFTYQGGIFDSQTGFYNTGSGYYDPATGQAFGCQDKGWWDPGEDLCGEDEYDPTGLGPGSAGLTSNISMAGNTAGLRTIGCTLSTRETHPRTTRLYGQSRVKCKTRFFYATISTNWFYVNGPNSYRIDFIPCNYNANAAHGITAFECPEGQGLAVDLTTKGWYVYYTCAVVILDVALPGRPRSGFGCTGFRYHYSP